MSSTTSIATHLTLEDYLANFPFPEIRDKQIEVLQQVCDTVDLTFEIC